MAIVRARTVEEYVDMVQQAVFEVEELYMAAEFDMESMGSTASFVDDLDKTLKALLSAMEDGSYQFQNTNLPFMGIVEKEDEKSLPFRFLLRRINETHRYGLEVED
jgi:hypothetical protein